MDVVRAAHDTIYPDSGPNRQNPGVPESRGCVANRDGPLVV
jgi:hypothetical protein